VKVAMIASECAPFAKTGGLADVVGALPRALKEQGHEVIVILPLYGTIDCNKYGVAPFMNQLGVWMGNTLEWCAVKTATLPGDVPVYFIEHDRFFKRDGLYHDAWYHDFSDNPRRFAFFTRAALQLMRDRYWIPDIVHAHDWQTALAPAFLKVWHWNDPILSKAASVLTIHNIAYQGIYGADTIDYTGLKWENFIPTIFEDHGRMNFLKGGIYFADMVNTVSPTYAEETRNGPLSHGMAPFLAAKGDRYMGILNGVDYSCWSPENDPFVPHHYSADDLSGKKAAKRLLQETMGLTVDERVPIVGIVSRFTYQKGLDVVAAVIEYILADMAVQFAILGADDKDLEHFYGTLPARFPGRVGSYIGRSEELSHLIEAGSDFFLMPSRWEPCGLNQMYSLRYGTLPIVRNTGGLADTVEQYDEKEGTGTGFKFSHLSEKAIYDTVGWAVSTWYDRPHHIATLQKTAMSKDFSWATSAKAYTALYERVRSIVNGGASL